MQCLACDFGGSSVKYALVDHRARMRDNGCCPAPLDSLTAFLDCLAQLYARFSGQAAGIALSLPGFIDAERGLHLGSGAYGPILKQQFVAKLVSARCGVPVSMENDGRCGALAELWDGALAGARDGAVLILGTAVGGGVITKGGVQRGAGFAAGEFSYAITAPGEYGPLSQAWMNVGVIGMVYKACKLKNIDLSMQDAGGMLVKYDALLKDHFPVFPDAPRRAKVDGRQILQWVDQGDGDACRIYAQFLRSLAVVIHNIQLCYGPEKVVLGGGLSRAERLLPDVRAELDRLYASCLVPPEARAALCLSRHLDECNLLGAAYQFLDQYGGGIHVS